MSSDDTSDNDTSNYHRALELRFKFEDFEYGFLWNCLQEAGWTVSAGSRLSKTGYQYNAPGGHGPVFDSWNAVAEYLDKFAIPEVYGNLELIVPEEQYMTDEQKQRGTELRRQAMQRVCSNSKDIILKASRHKSTENHNNIETAGLRQLVIQPHKSSVNNKRGSITQTDEGTELYLHRKKLPSAKRRREADLSSSSSLNNLNSKRALPSISEAIGFLNTQDSNEGRTSQQQYQRDFQHWRFLLSTNQSLLFFGAGSKYDLLAEFAEQELSKEGFVLQIDGFDENATMHNILNLLVAKFLAGQEPESRGRIERHDGSHHVVGQSNPWRASPLVERAILVSRSCAYEACETLFPIFIVIHNLDGETLRNRQTLEALAALVVNSNVGNCVQSIRLVASVDNIVAPEIMFTPEIAANLSWIYLPVHTHRPYIKELNMLRHIGKKQGKDKPAIQSVERVERVEEVLELLAPRHTEVMHVLVRLQLEQQHGSQVKMALFRSECQKAHIINKDSNLDPILTELKDHGLIHVDRNRDGDFIRAPFDRTKLVQLSKYRR